MKKITKFLTLLLLLTIGAGQMWGAVGAVDQSLQMTFTVDGNDVTKSNLKNSGQGIIDLGEVSTVRLKSYQFYSYKSSSDNICGAGQMHYRVYKTSASGGAWTNINNNIYWNTPDKGSSESQRNTHKNDVDADLLSGIEEAGQYCFECYFDIDVCGGNRAYLSNNSQNYKVTFTIASSCTANTVSWTTTPTNGTVGGSMTIGASATGGSVQYKSSNTSVATVDGTTLNYVGKGSATITAYVKDDATYCDAEVTKNITVSNPTFTFANGSTWYFDFTAISGGANWPKADGTEDYDANAGGTVKETTFSKDVIRELGEEWGSLKTATGSWANIKLPESTPSLGQNCLIVRADGKTAVWGTYAPIRQYTLTYDGNDNTAGKVPADPQSYDYNTEVTVLGNVGTPALSKTDSKFNGWNTQADGQGTPYVAGATITMTTDVTLFAQWTPISVTLTPSKTEALKEEITLTPAATGFTPTEYRYSYKVNEGGYTVIETKATADPLSFSNFTEYGTYTFKVVATDGVLTAERLAVVNCVIPRGLVYSQKGGATGWTGYTESLVLTENDLAVTLDGNNLKDQCYFAFTTATTAGWTPGSQYNAVGESDVEVVVDDENPTATSRGASKALYIQPEGIANYNLTFHFDITTGNVNVTSVRKSYTITYNANGGECSTESVNVNAGDATVLPFASKTQDDNFYLFEGWYTEAVGGELVGKGGANYTPTATRTLYAHWGKMLTQILPGDRIVFLSATEVKAAWLWNNGGVSYNFTKSGTYNGKTLSYYDNNKDKYKNAIPLDCSVTDGNTTWSYNNNRLTSGDVNKLDKDYNDQILYYEIQSSDKGGTFAEFTHLSATGTLAFKDGSQTVESVEKGGRISISRAGVTLAGTLNSGSTYTYYLQKENESPILIAENQPAGYTFDAPNVVGDYTLIAYAQDPYKYETLLLTDPENPIVLTVFDPSSSKSVVYGVNGNGSITVKNGEEIVESGSAVPDGTSLTFTATPEENKIFLGWFSDSECTTPIPSMNVTNPCVVVVEENISAYAKFDTPWRLDGNFNEGGSEWDTDIRFMPETAGQATGTCAIDITTFPKDATTPADYYEFKLRQADAWFGYGTDYDAYATVERSNCTNFTLYNNSGNDHNVRFIPDVLGRYIFLLDKTAANPKVSVLYPNKVVFGANAADEAGVTVSATLNAQAFTSGHGVQSGEVLTLTTSATDGAYTFVGWYANEDCVGEVLSTESTFEATISAESYFYAKWEHKKALVDPAFANILTTESKIFTLSNNFAGTGTYKIYTCDVDGNNRSEIASGVQDNQYTFPVTAETGTYYRIASITVGGTEYFSDVVTINVRQQMQYYYRGAEYSGWETPVAMTNSDDKTYAYINITADERFKMVDNTINYGGYSKEYINNHFLSNHISLSYVSSDYDNLNAESDCRAYVFYPYTSVNPGSTPIFCAGPRNEAPHIATQYVVLSIGVSEVLPNTTITLSTTPVGCNPVSYGYEYSLDNEANWTPIAENANASIIFTPRESGAYVFRATARLNDGSTLTDKGYVTVSVADKVWYLEHKWDGSNKTWVATTPNYDGSYYYIGNYYAPADLTDATNGKAIWFNTEEREADKQHVVSPELINAPVSGDRCLITLYPEKAYGVEDIKYQPEKPSHTITVRKLTATTYNLTYGVFESVGGSLTTTVNSGAYVTDGTIVTFTATPAPGYCLEGWYDSELCTYAHRIMMPNSHSYSIPVIADTKVYVKFVKHELAVRGENTNSVEESGMPGWTSLAGMEENGANACFEQVLRLKNGNYKLELYDRATGTYYGSKTADQTMSATAGGWTLNGSNSVLFTTTAASQDATAEYKVVAHLDAEGYPVVGIIYPGSEATRTGMTVGKLSTVCYPQAMYHNVGDHFYQIVGKITADGTRSGTPRQIVLEEVDFLLPGMPYLVRVNSESYNEGVQADLTWMKYGDVAASALNHNGLYGTFTSHAFNADPNYEEGKYYVLNDNKFKIGSNKSGAAANRAFVKMDEVPLYEEQVEQVSDPMAPSRILFLNADGGSQLPTALEQNSEQAENTAVKMLRDGRVLILRADKIYDLNGRLIETK